MRIIIFSLVLIFSSAAYAQNAYLENVHYHVLKEPVRTVTPGKIEVTHAFAFDCKHCFNFEQHIVDWVKSVPEDVVLVKLPVIWKPEMEYLARMLYVGKALNKFEEINSKIFETIHLKKIAINSEAIIYQLFRDVGIDQESVDKTWISLEVSNMVEQAKVTAISMKVASVPQIIVDGHYTVSIKDLGPNKLLDVVNFLIDKVRRERTIPQ